MTIARQDAWNQDEDLLLAEVVLRHIREGSTQLRAFEEVGRQLSRTSAACGFRWNSFVRKQYKSGIELAKKQRKVHKKEDSIRLDGKTDEIENINLCDFSQGEEFKEIPERPLITLEMVLSYITEKDGMAQLYQQAREQSSVELDHALQENKRLSQEIKSLKEQLTTVEEDYQALLKIMDRARKLIVYEEDKANSKVKFQMDKNGNLERVNRGTHY